MRHRDTTTRRTWLGADAERTIQQGRFLCPREGAERRWRVVASHRTYVGHAELQFEQRAHDPYATVLVCDGCLHRFELEAGRPITEAERKELFRAGLGREELIKTACDVGRSGRATPYFSSVLQTLSGALGYSMEEITSRLAA